MLEIVDDPDEISINKRSEVTPQGRHRNKYKLITLVTNKKDWHHIIMKVARSWCQ